eukprot:1486711-Rhodomonas_salina.1
MLETVLFWEANLRMPCALVGGAGHVHDVLCHFGMLTMCCHFWMLAEGAPGAAGGDRGGAAAGGRAAALRKRKRKRKRKRIGRRGRGIGEEEEEGDDGC